MVLNFREVSFWIYTNINGYHYISYDNAEFLLLIVKIFLNGLRINEKTLYNTIQILNCFAVTYYFNTISRRIN